jgi:hypothetical protein
MGHSVLNIEGGIALALVLLALLRSTNAAPGALNRLNKHDALGIGALGIGALALATIVVFIPTAGYYFLSDDFLLLKHAASFWNNFPAIFITPGGDGFYRPITYLSLALTAPWADSNPTPWHLAAIFLHALNTVLVFALARTLGLARLASYFAAALFAVHASRPEAVVWTAARADLLATCFTLIALWSFIRSRYSISLLCLTLAVLSKESAYTVPLVLLVYVTFERRPWRPLIPFFAVAAALAAWRWYLFGGIGGYVNPAGQPEALTLNGVSILNTLALRLWAILVFPINWSSPPALLLAAITVVYVATLLWLAATRAPRRAIILLIAWVLLLALPPLQQLLIGPDLQKSRLLYLPSVAFCLLLATLLDSHAPKSQWAIAVAALVFNVAALFHNLTFWRQASQKAHDVCIQAAACSNKSAIQGLPPSLNGVYFFANGFEECVELQHIQPAGPCTLPYDIH